MNKKKIVKAILILGAVILNIFIFRTIKTGNADITSGHIVMNMKSDNASVYQIYYTNDGELYDTQSSTVAYTTPDNRENLNFDADLSMETLKFNFGYEQANIEIYDIWIMSAYRREKVDLALLADSEYFIDIESKEYDGHCLKIKSSGSSPQLVVNIDTIGAYNHIQDRFDRDTFVVDVVLCLVIDLLVLYILLHFSTVWDLPADVYRNRKLIFTLAKNDFKTKFAGSYLGIIWAFVQPVVTVLTYWFVFQFGFRTGRISEFPFVIWLTVGMVPWFFFSDAVNGGTNVLMEYSYLVKKVVFKIDVLPIVKMISAFFVHCFFVIFVILLCWVYGYAPDLYDLQLIYYILCNFILAVGIIYLTSAVVVFFRDLTQIIGIILQVGIWMAPIMWDAERMLSPQLLIIFKLNPMFYIVDGFRDALLEKAWLWDKGLWTIYFWIVIMAIYLLGTSMFRKLKIHFADVL